MALELNKQYHIVLYPTWGLSYDLLIIGIVNQKTIANFDKAADIKKIFFDDYNLGINTYLRLITSSTAIYIAYPITSLDPIETQRSDDKRVFLPESLIDFTKTYEYVSAKKYDFDISSGVKKFKNTLAENEFVKEIKVKIRKIINTMDEFIVDTISVEASSTEVLTTESYLKQLEKEKNELINLRNLSILQRETNLADNQLALYEQIHKEQEAQRKYEEQKIDLLQKLNNITAQEHQNTIINNILFKIKEVMREMISQIKSGRIEPENIPSFDELYEQIQRELYG
jgi:hypothetical protein